MYVSLIVGHSLGGGILFYFLGSVSMPVPGSGRTKAILPPPTNIDEYISPILFISENGHHNDQHSR